MIPEINIDELNKLRPMVTNKGGRPKGTGDSPLNQLKGEVKATTILNKRIREMIDKALLRVEILMGQDPSLAPTLEILDGLTNALDKTGKSMTTLGKMVLVEGGGESGELSNEDLLKLVT